MTSRTTTASDAVMRGLRALSVTAVLAVLVAAFVWSAVMVGLGALFIAGVSGPGSVGSLAPVVLFTLGVAVLVLLVRADWWSRGWSGATTSAILRKVVVGVLALATLGYGGLVVNASPMLYGIGDAHNAWTLSEMIRFDLVRIEEMDVGACMNIRYRTRGAPPSHLVQPVDCAGPHSTEVIGIHLVDGPADGDVAARQLLAEEVCAAGWERVGHAYGGQVSWVVRRDGSPRERSVICGVDDTD